MPEIAILANFSDLLLNNGRKMLESDPHKLLEIANLLRAEARSKISRQNGTSSEEKAIAWWRQETGVDPVQFYALTLIHASLIGGSRPPLAKARENALLTLRPDLFFRDGVLSQPCQTPSRNRRALGSRKEVLIRNARRDVSKRLKGLIERPPFELVQRFRQTKKAWEDAIRKPNFSQWRQKMANLGVEQIGHNLR